jgi:phosphate transport system substrate-binding protein
MNNRIAALLTAVCAFPLLASCGGNAEAPPTPSETQTPVVVTVSPEPTVTPTVTEITPFDRLSKELSALWNRIDGSTATIPLTTALHGVFGATGSPPRHGTTYSAYDRLFTNKAELIFVTYPSEYEFTEAQDRGVDLDIIPVVKDALVFLVNIENPVDGISLEQARDIYTGEITNWEALGGADGGIVAYQRPQSSGSQTLLMKLVMGGEEPVRPPSDWSFGDMGGLVEAVSSYNNAENAIGYSVFYYVNNMYGNSRFKLLGVDGVKPSRETIGHGEYPLEDYYYAVMRKDAPVDSPARKLVDWLLTDDGQTMAARAGYIPLHPLENVFPDETLDPVYLGDTYNSSGTGGMEPKPIEAIDELVVNGVRKPLSDVFYDGFNYIQYINGRITDQINSSWSLGEFYDYSTAAELATRPFTGIPNDYPNYKIEYWNEDNRYLRIEMPEDNPFFNRPLYFDIHLTADISPYGGTVPDGSPITYDRYFDRQILPDVDLIALSVEMRQSPEIAERINSQLKAWTDGFPGEGENAKLLNSFLAWYTESYLYDYLSTYILLPIFGSWEDYISVSYPLRIYDGGGPPIGVGGAVFDTICFDISTGEEVDLAKCLPNDLPYSTSTASEYGNTPFSFDEKYTPVEGSVITSAWISDDGMLSIYVTEPDGRRLQVNFWDWE